MPRRDWRDRVADIVDAAAAIRSHLAGLSEDEFRASRLVSDAVERNFAVIGEAAAHIPDDLRDRHPEVPWSRMRRMRNFLVHVYFGVDHATLWETAQQDLPPLIAALQAMLAAEPTDEA